MPTFPIFSSGSMKVLGSLASEAIAMYPSTLSIGFETKVSRFLGDQEQRWTSRSELFGAELSYRSLNGYDLSLLVDFFRLCGGRDPGTNYAKAFDITIAAANYQYCVFDQDKLSISSEPGEKFSTTLRIKQLRRND